MADAVDSRPRDAVLATHRPRTRTLRVTSQLRQQRKDLWLAATGLIVSLLALPLAQSSWHGPEVAAVLAVSATALFAGQRWAIAVIVVADLFLLPTVWPRAFLGGDLATRIVALATLVAMLPGLVAMRRAAAVLVVMTGRPRTQQMCHRVHVGLIAVSVVAVLVPLL